MLHKDMTSAAQYDLLQLFESYESGVLLPVRCPFNERS